MAQQLLVVLRRGVIFRGEIKPVSQLAEMEALMERELVGLREMKEVLSVLKAAFVPQPLNLNSIHFHM